MQIKKSVAVFIIMILAVVGLNSNQALAAELSSYSTEVNFDNQETNSKGTFELIKINNNRATFPGNGGTCSLEYLSSGKYIWWQVQPATPASIYFYGYITISRATSSLVVAEIPVSGVGPSGIVGVSGIADVMSFGLSKGTLYKAQLTGIAEAGDGYVFNTVPNAIITFVY